MARPKPREFEKEVLPHLRDLYGGALRLAKNSDDASDLVQETCLRAYRFWSSFERGTNCRAWLFRIMTNVFFTEFNRRKRRAEIYNQAGEEQKIRDGVMIQKDRRSMGNPEQEVLDRSLSDEVQAALGELSPEFRVAIVLCDMQGFSYKETADILECPIGTVMSRLHRGRKVLAKQLRTYAEQQGILPEKKRENLVQLDDFRQGMKHDQ